MATLHTSSHRRALIPTQQGKSISIISTVPTTTERIECQESQRRRKWADRHEESRESQKGFGELVGAPELALFSLSLPLSLFHSVVPHILQRPGIMGIYAT